MKVSTLVDETGKKIAEIHEDFKKKKTLIIEDGCDLSKFYVLKKTEIKIDTAKQCINCGKIKTLSDFHKNRNNKDGRMSWCKECRKPMDKLYRKLNREAINKKNLKYYHENIEEVKAQRRKYKKSEKAKEIMRESSRKRKEEHPEKHEANRVLRMAVLMGKVRKPYSCELCGKTRCRINGHHWHGYDKEHQLDVQWLCDACHHKEHREKK